MASEGDARRHGATKYLVDHHCQVLSLLTVVRPQLFGSALNRNDGSSPERAFLLTAKQPGSQPSANRIRKLFYQP